MNDELYTLEQCAGKIDMSVSTIKREIADGRLVPTRIRGGVRIAPSDWEEYLKKCRSASTEQAGKFAFSTKDKDLAGLLTAIRTLPNLNAGRVTKSQIVELAAHRSTRSRKRSSGG